MGSQDPRCPLSPSSWARRSPPPPPLFSQSRCVGAKGPELTNEQKCPLGQQPTGSGTQGSHRTGIVSTVSARSSGKLTLSTNRSQMWRAVRAPRPREKDSFYYYSSISFSAVLPGDRKHMASKQIRRTLVAGGRSFKQEYRSVIMHRTVAGNPSSSHGCQSYRGQHRKNQDRHSRQLDLGHRQAFP